MVNAFRCITLHFTIAVHYNDFVFVFLLLKVRFSNNVVNEKKYRFLDLFNKYIYLRL